jgi:hypothetical protein
MKWLVNLLKALFAKKLKVNGIVYKLKKQFTLEDWELSEKVEAQLAKLNPSGATGKAERGDVLTLLQLILRKKDGSVPTAEELNKISLVEVNAIIADFFFYYNKAKITIANNWQNSAKRLTTPLPN